MLEWSAGRSVPSWPTRPSRQAIFPAGFAARMSTTSPSPNGGGCLSESSKAQARPAAFPTCRVTTCTDDFVPRPEEYGSLKDAVLSAGRDATIGITTTLQGAGGYGKTTLANALCRDSDIRFEFTDGILRVEIGKVRNDVTGLIVDLIEKLDPNAKRPGFQDIQTASEHLGELIGEARLLLVIDDVWREAQL
jgi:NB-ARC domain